MKQYTHIAVIIAIGTTMSGCAAFISSRGQFSNALSYGNTRQSIAAQLGEPAQSITTNYPATGSTETFDVFLKDGKIYRPVADFAAMAYLDAYTLGLYELYGTPKAIVEHMQARKALHKIDVHYFDDGSYMYHCVTRIEKTNESSNN